MSKPTQPLHPRAHHTDTSLILGKDRGHRIDVRASHDLTSMRGLENARACADEWWGEFFLTDAPAKMGVVIRSSDITPISLHDLSALFSKASQRLRQHRCPRSPRQGRIDAWLAKRA